MSNGKPQKRVKQRNKPYGLHQSDISNYLNQMKKAGRTEGTITKYRTDLTRFEHYLGEEKIIYPESAKQWRQSMIDDSYAPRTINTSLVALNGFLGYIGCQDWQVFDWLELEDAEGLELSRDEYQLLLEETKREENIQLYLMVKILACADLTPGDLPLLTRETVNDGVVRGRMRGTEREVTIPELLRIDLLDFAIQRGIRTGPIFRNNKNRPYNRTAIANMISNLGSSVGLEPGKANPRNLRKLYQNTLAEFQEKADAWVKQSYMELLDQEEQQVGWRIWQTKKGGSISPTAYIK